MKFYSTLIKLNFSWRQYKKIKKNITFSVFCCWRSALSCSTVIIRRSFSDMRVELRVSYVFPQKLKKPACSENRYLTSFFQLYQTSLRISWSDQVICLLNNLTFVAKELKIFLTLLFCSCKVLITSYKKLSSTFLLLKTLSRSGLMDPSTMQVQMV